MPKYDLSLLTEFNKGLVYGFFPESSSKRKAGSELLEDYLYHNVGQQIDVLDAYLFAQNVVLPELNTGFDNLTPEKLLFWIKQIHQRIAGTLLNSINVPSGEYYQGTVLSWHQDNLIANAILAFLSGSYPMDIKDFAKACSKKFACNTKELTDFINLLLRRFANDTSIQLSCQQQQEASGDKGMTMLVKMSAVYHSDYFSDAEKQIIKRIVIIFPPAEQVPSAMEKYAAGFVKEMKGVDRNDINSIVNFIAERFFELIKIHPFPNANKRTATCLMNMMLRAFNQPSILLRDPNERDNHNSSYSRALATISENRRLLKAHIKQRILDESKEPYSNKKLEKTTELRVAMALICKRIEAKHPHVDINQAVKEAQKTIPPIVLAVKDEELIKHHMLQAVIASLGTMETQLDEKKAASKETVINKLRIISGESAWKAYRNNSVYLLENPPHISDIAEKLKATDAMKVTISRRADNQIPVLKIEEVNAVRLRSYSTPDVQEIDSASTASPYCNIL